MNCTFKTKTFIGLYLWRRTHDYLVHKKLIYAAFKCWLKDSEWCRDYHKLQTTCSFTHTQLPPLPHCCVSSLVTEHQQLHRWSQEGRLSSCELLTSVDVPVLCMCEWEKWAGMWALHPCAARASGVCSMKVFSSFRQTGGEQRWMIRRHRRTSLCCFTLHFDQRTHFYSVENISVCKEALVVRVSL